MPDHTADFYSQSIISSGSATPLNLSIENPSFNLNDPQAWDLLMDGEPAASGIRVTRERALSLPAVWQAVSLISGDVAKLPFDLFRRLDGDDRDKATDHPTHNLVRRKPNREMDAFKFWRRVMVHLLIFNKAYVYISQNGDGSPAELLPLLPDRTAPERINGQLVYVTEVGEEGRLRSLFPEQVFCLEGITCDNLEALDVLKFARDAWGLALAEMKFASKFFQRGGRIGGVLEIPSSMTKGVVDKIEQGFRKSYEGDDEPFKTVILRDNAKFHQGQMSPEQMLLTEGRRESVRDVARVFNIRPSKLGEESGVSYKSKSEDNRDYYDTTLSHPLSMIAAQANDKLLTKLEKADGYYFEHNTAALLMMDFKSVCEAINTLRSSEVISPNEARRLINMNRRKDPGGDDYRNPNTKSDKSTTAKPAENEDLANAHRKLLTQAMARMVGVISDKAQRNAGSEAKFCDWLDNKFEQIGEPVRAAIAPIVEAHAVAIAVEHAALVDAAVASLMRSVRGALDDIASTSSVSSLKGDIAAKFTQFIQSDCGSLAESIIPAGDLRHAA